MRAQLGGAVLGASRQILAPRSRRTAKKPRGRAERGLHQNEAKLLARFDHPARSWSSIAPFWEGETATAYIRDICRCTEGLDLERRRWRQGCRARRPTRGLAGMGRLLRAAGPRRCENVIHDEALLITPRPFAAPTKCDACWLKKAFRAAKPAFC